MHTHTHSHTQVFRVLRNVTDAELRWFGVERELDRLEILRNLEDEFKLVTKEMKVQEKEKRQAKQWEDYLIAEEQLEKTTASRRKRKVDKKRAGEM